jgi:hypothetical protein
MLDILWSACLPSWWSTSTYLHPHEGQAVLPAMLLGFLLPSTLMFAPFLSSLARQYLVIIWMFFPLYIVIIQHTFSRIFPKGIKFSSINTLWKVSFALCASTHLLVLGVCVAGMASISSVFNFRSGPSLSVEDSNYNMFLCNLYVTFGAGLLWSFVSFLDLQRFGLAGKQDGLVIASYMTVGTLLVGPGAVISASAMRRSEVLRDDEYDSRGRFS